MVSAHLIGFDQFDWASLQQVGYKWQKSTTPSHAIKENKVALEMRNPKLSKELLTTMLVQHEIEIGSPLTTSKRRSLK